MSQKICHYLDMPIQHASDNVLKRMGRKTDKQELLDIVVKLRKEIPDIALRTTLIAGFQEETQADHEEVMEFIDEVEFDRLEYSLIQGKRIPPAATMPDQIEKDIMDMWRDELMALQQEISIDKSAQMVGKTIDVMVEGYIAEDNTYVGRSYKDAP